MSTHTALKILIAPLCSLLLMWAALPNFTAAAYASDDSALLLVERSDRDRNDRDDERKLGSETRRDRDNDRNYRDRDRNYRDRDRDDREHRKQDEKYDRKQRKEREKRMEHDNRNNKHNNRDNDRRNKPFSPEGERWNTPDRGHDSRRNLL